MRFHRVLLSVATLSVLAPAGLASQTVSATADVPQVRAEGTAKRSLRPDLATLTVQFTADGKSPREAGRSVAMRADSLRRAFRGIGIPQDSLLSGSRWYWWRGRVEPLITSRYVRAIGSSRASDTQVVDTVFRVHDMIEVRIRDLSKVGAVIDSALAHGILEISPVHFSLSEQQALKETLLREATANARRQAEAMAGADGSRLGRIISLTTQPDWRYDPYLSGMSLASSYSAGDAGATTVVQPSITTAVTVYARWELLPK